MTAPGLDAVTRSALVRAGTPALANILLRHGVRRTMMTGVHTLAPDGAAMAGPAFTVRFIPSREDLDDMATYARDDNPHRRAVEECPAGSVLVMDAGGSSAASSMGDLMALRMRLRGVEGVVTDGGFRDSAGVVATGLPAFQRANAGPPTPIALRAVALDEPIGCAGVAVYPGDVVVGDADGVVVVPSHLVSAVAAEATRSADYEVFAEREIRSGRSIFDVLPATPASLVRFDEWMAQGHPGME